MKKKIISSAILVTMLFQSVPAFASNKINSVKSYDVSVSDSLKVPFYSTDDNFKGGLVPGFGSSVAFKGYDSDGDMQFYAITDRGPNGDAPQYMENGKSSDAKLFTCPDFTPSIGIITIKNDSASVNYEIELKDSTGKKITGLPLAPGSIGATGEAALNLDLNNIGYDSEGLDTEGIDVDKEGNFWICDEYGPFIIKADSTGKILEKYGPGEGLPEILKYRIPNRGFEGIAVTPSGKIIAAVQSVLDVDGQTSKTACFTRMVEFDPETKETKMLAYPVDLSQYKSPKDCKIGDIYAVNDNTLLVIEQGKLKDKTMSNVVYKVDLTGATDISGMTYNGKALEYADSETELPNIKFMTKEKYIDLRAEGWTSEKAEGICVLPDKKTIAVTNDNNFGITTNISDSFNKDTDITDYVYNSETKQFAFNGVKAEPKISVVPNNDPAQIWIFKADKAVDDKTEESESGYVKLRDAAMALKGTQNEFSVDFDASVKSIFVKTGEIYKNIGTEDRNMPAVNTDNNTQAGWTLYVNGTKSNIKSVNVNGNNCFKLSDLESVLGL
ncbi:MAG: esterase-like activity of phytase family protein [Clostridia bacterium]|jgi:hypothetical protein|nr:esterase-like activity of phytase family protein [Clostridia bacterium]